MNGLKAQSSVEFLMQYSWAVVLLVLTISAVVAIGLVQHQIATTSSYCYISPEIDCYQTTFAENAMGSGITTLFTNLQNTPVLITGYSVSPASGLGYAAGSCNMTVLLPGQSAQCSTFISGFTPTEGSKVNPVFNIQYKECSGTCTQKTETKPLQIEGSAVVSAPSQLGPGTPLFSTSSTSTVSTTATSSSTTTTGGGGGSTSTASSTVSTTAGSSSISTSTSSISSSTSSASTTQSTSTSTVLTTSTTTVCGDCSTSTSTSTLSTSTLSTTSTSVSTSTASTASTTIAEELDAPAPSTDDSTPNVGQGFTLSADVSCAAGSCSGSYSYTWYQGGSQICGSGSSCGVSEGSSGAYGFNYRVVDSVYGGSATSGSTTVNVQSTSTTSVSTSTVATTSTTTICSPVTTEVFVQTGDEHTSGNGNGEVCTATASGSTTVDPSTYGVGSVSVSVESDTDSGWYTSQVTTYGCSQIGSTTDPSGGCSASNTGADTSTSLSEDVSSATSVSASASLHNTDWSECAGDVHVSAFVTYTPNSC